MSQGNLTPCPCSLMLVFYISAFRLFFLRYGFYQFLFFSEEILCFLLCLWIGKCLFWKFHKHMKAVSNTSCILLANQEVPTMPKRTWIITLNSSCGEGEFHPATYSLRESVVKLLPILTRFKETWAFFHFPFHLGTVCLQLIWVIREAKLK